MDRFNVANHLLLHAVLVRGKPVRVIYISRKMSLASHHPNPLIGRVQKSAVPDPKGPGIVELPEDA